MSAGPLNYFEVQELTAELIHRLDAVRLGHATHESLQAWARAAWGGSQEGPVQSNRTATEVLMYAWNAAETSPADGAYILRPCDAAAYIRKLKQGTAIPPLQDLGGLKIPLRVIAAQLGLDSERVVIDGLGWFEHLQFASLGTGRVYALSEPMEHRPGKCDTAVLVSGAADPSEVVRDLLETLALDLADVHFLEPGFDVVTLPRWTLHQDDAGTRTAIATFTGFRKAEAVLRQFEATPDPRLTHWLEELPPSAPAVSSSSFVSPSASSSSLELEL